MKLTESQKKYLLLLKTGNFFRVDEEEESVRIRGYSLRIQYNTFRKFKEAELVSLATNFKSEQPHIKYYTITPEGIRILEQNL